MVQSGIINGPDHDKTEITKFLLPKRIAMACNLRKSFNFQSRQIYILNEEAVIEPCSTSRISVRYMAGLNSVKLLAELTDKLYPQNLF